MRKTGIFSGAFNINGHLICTKCFYKMVKKSQYPSLYFAANKPVKAASENKCACGNEYGSYESEKYARKLIAMSKKSRENNDGQTTV